MNKRIIVILSKKENFLGSAEKIKEICKTNTEIHYVEDIMNNIDYISNNDVIFVLANGPLVDKFVIDLKDKKCYVINKLYFLRKHDKLHIQKILMKKGINIPRIIDAKELINCKYPIFVKENNHAGIVFKAYTPKTVEVFFSKFPINDYYFEENVCNSNENSKEYKLYYANGIVACKDGVECSDNTVGIVVTKVAKALELEALSIDIIVSNGKCFVIDVNPAPGFYFCTVARQELVRFMENLK